MNVFLSIKNKKHENKYYESMDHYTAQSLYTQALLGVLALIFIPFVQYETIKKSNFNPSAIAYGVSKCVFFLALVITGLSARLFWKRLQKYHRAARWGLDLLNLLLAAYLCWTYSKDRLQNTLISGWWNAFIVMTVFISISRWYLKIIAYSSVVAVAFTVQYMEIHATRILLTMACILIYFALSTYFLHRYEISRFLEKQKLYEETKTFKQILDLTTDGIMIYSLKEELMYKNWEDQRYSWWNEQESTGQNLRSIKIDQKKSILNVTCASQTTNPINTVKKIF